MSASAQPPFYSVINTMAQSRPRKHKLKAGDKIGSLTILQRVRDNKTTRSANLKMQVRVECVCGTRMTIPQYYLTRENPKTSCGCLNKTIKTIYNEEYRCYLMMHQRCENPSHVAYNHYAGRGIKIHPLFHKYFGLSADQQKSGVVGEEGFKNWLKEMGPRPSRKYSCDRIDNTRGYEPGNIRWADGKTQRANQGNKIDGKEKKKEA
jgi:hypothetical protein